MTFDTEQELEQINRYTRKTLTEDDVYRFTLTLCDNEIDRDLERFTPAALEELAALFVGKTGIFDHSCKSEQQSARLYHCWVETDKTRATSCGEAYTCLKARAYMVRTKENEGLIAEIEGGIKKEVSVGCAMGSLCCSVCGADRRTAGCEHIKGRTYNGRLCHDVLSDATDAYEWSFVAVPAQREAGVTKAFSKEAPMTESILETVKSAKTEGAADGAAGGHCFARAGGRGRKGVPRKAAFGDRALCADRAAADRQVPVRAGLRRYADSRAGISLAVAAEADEVHAAQKAAAFRSGAETDNGQPRILYLTEVI